MILKLILILNILFIIFGCNDKIKEDKSTNKINITENQKLDKQGVKLTNEKEKKEKIKSLNKLKKEYDDISGITWYTQPYFTHYNNSNLTSIYFGQKGNNLWLRLKMSYKGDDWIFFNRAFLSYEGNTKEIMFDEYLDKESDNAYGAVWEWIDVAVPEDLENFLKALARSKMDTVKSKVTVYYIGEKRVSESEYNRSDGYIYFLHDYRQVDKATYESFKKSGLYNLPEPRKVEKRMEIKTNISLKTYAKMRLIGKYAATRNLSADEIQGILDILNGYDLLKDSLYNKL
jgi:hypothetical protein